MIRVGLHNEALYYGQQQKILFTESSENLGCLFSFKNDKVVWQP